jgi:hypothetical protein
MEARKRFQEGVFDQVQIALVKCRSKANRAGAGVIVHGEESSPKCPLGRKAEQGCWPEGGVVHILDLVLL